MAARLAVLILVLCLNVVGFAAAAVPSCLQCHPRHYSDLDSCTGCHRGDGRTVRKNVAHAGLVAGELLRYRVPGSSVAENGGEWIRRAGCRRCHAFKGKGNMLVGSLDRLPGRHPDRILASIVQPGSFMPDFHFDRGTAATIVNTVLASQLPAQGGDYKAPVPVRFTKGGGTTGHLFDKQCGGCHRVLTKKFGGLGRGSAGPNLSGLLSGHYPESYAAGKRWTADRLEKWLANPRKSIPLARMQPIMIKNSDFRGLLTIFDPSPP